MGSATRTIVMEAESEDWRQSMRIRAEAEFHQLPRQNSDVPENLSSQSIQELQTELRIQEIQLRLLSEEIDRLKTPVDTSPSHWDVRTIGDVVDSLGGIFWTADFDSLRMSYISDRAEQILGYPVSDWLTKDNFWQDHIHHLDREEVLKKCFFDDRRVKDRYRGIGHRHLYRMVAADGRSVWIDDMVGVNMKDGKPTELYGLMVDVTESVENKARLGVEKEMLELIASGAPLKESLSALALAIERHQGDIRCSILLADDHARVLRHGAAPSLPEEYINAIDGIAIADSVGSCCTAAFRRQLIIVEDISTDPMWADYKNVALRHSLRACWSSPIMDANGNVLGIFGVYKNEPGRPTPAHLQLIELATHIAVIAICKDRTETSLRTSERELRLVLDNIPGLVARVDRDLRYQYVNDQYGKEFGKPRDSVVGMRNSDVIGQDLFAQGEPYYKQALDGKSVTFESCSVTSLGIKKHWLSKLVPELDADSSVIGFFVMAFDVSATKHANEQREGVLRLLQKVAGEIPGFVFQYRLRPDGTACLPYASERIREIYRLAPEDLVDDCSTIFDLHHPDDSERINQSILESAVTLMPWSQEFRVCHEDGTLRWVHANSIPERDSDGSTLWHGYLYDITERKSSEASSIELETRLRESQKLEAIGTLAGGIAHDFNNILTIILGSAEIGRMDLLNGNHGAVDRNLGEISKAGERARDLVRQIIAFSRKEPTRFKPMQLAPVVEESVRLLRATLPSRLTVETDINESTPWVEGDRNLIQQVVVNLATNSMQAMEGRQGTIRIRLDSVMIDDDTLRSHPAALALQRRQPGPLARLVVSDNGCGMDRGTIARIFEPFFTTKSTGEGTGLGLAVVHGIVRSHSGEILLNSEPNVGTTFTVYFPTVPTKDMSGTAISSMTPSVSEIAIATKSCDRSETSVLLIDDDLAVLRSMKCILDSLGYEVRAYADQIEAMDLLRSDPTQFDYVIVDYNMSGLSGIDIAQNVRSMRDDLHVVIMSGFIDDELLEATDALGIRGVLQKPCSRSDLRGLIE